MQTIEMDLARLVSSGLVTMEIAQAVSAYPAEIQAQLSTLRAQAQAAATAAAGQAATSGSGQRVGDDTVSNADGEGEGDAGVDGDHVAEPQPATAG